MPSKTPAQEKLMRIAAHTPGGYGGVPQKVGKDFEKADESKDEKPKSLQKRSQEKMYGDKK